MQELKRNFAAAKMNKDMDERLVPQGQYRDALNIQIATSDGPNVGTAQTLHGNDKKSSIFNSPGAYNIPLTSTCVGSIAVPDKDKIYYFVSAGTDNSTGTVSAPIVNGVQDPLSIRKDYILEYDSVTQKHKYVFVDIYCVTATAAATTTSSDKFVYIPDLGPLAVIINKTGVRIGMEVTGTFNGVEYVVGDGIIVKDIQYDTGNNRWKIILSHAPARWCFIN